MISVCGGIGTITPKANNPNPEPKGSEKMHRPAGLPMRLLQAKNIQKLAKPSLSISKKVAFLALASSINASIERI